MSDDIGATQLRSLVQLISDNVEQIIAQYSKINQKVPSLDYLGTGPFDAPENCDKDLVEAIKVVEGACAQLSATVASPAHVITNKAFSFIESSCINVVTTGKIADILEEHPSGLSLDDISTKSGLEKNKLARVLRYLATKNVFHESAPGIFINNRLSLKLKNTDPIGSLAGHLTDEVMIGSTKLCETMADPKLGPSDTVQDAPFHQAHGCSVFELYASEGGRARAERFNKAMVGWSSVTGTANIVKAYPWGDLPKNTTICDIGGGNGHVVLDLLKKYSGLKAVVQDFGAVLEDARTFWEKNCPEAVKEQRVEFAQLDFFAGPPAQHCDLYYLRCVIHDWNDVDSLRILKNVRKAMQPGNRLLIHEFALQPLVRQNHPSIKEAPEPLLANYGSGTIKVFNCDIDMLCSLNSKERFVTEFIELCSKAGFKFVKPWDCGDMCIMEFAPDA